MNVQMKVHVLRTFVTHLLVHMYQKEKITPEKLQKKNCNCKLALKNFQVYAAGAVDAVCQFKLPRVWARPVCSHSVVQGLCWPCVQSCVENKTFRYCEISGYGCSDPVSSIYTWSKNFRHLAYEKSGANMAGIDVQNKLPVHKIIVLFLKSMSKCQILAHSLPNLEP